VLHHASHGSVASSLLCVPVPSVCARRHNRAACSSEEISGLAERKLTDWTAGESIVQPAIAKEWKCGREEQIPERQEENPTPHASVSSAGSSIFSVEDEKQQQSIQPSAVRVQLCQSISSSGALRSS
jgi:hypothetical protein